MVSDSSSEVPSDSLEDDDVEIPKGHVVLWLVSAVCVIVVLSVVVLLVVQPGKKPASTKLCYDSAMQMEMPCNLTP